MRKAKSSKAVKAKVPKTQPKVSIPKADKDVGKISALMPKVRK